MLGFRHVNTCIKVEFNIWNFQWYVSRAQFFEKPDKENWEAVFFHQGRTKFFIFDSIKIKPNGTLVYGDGTFQPMFGGA